jgi:hypothetical protein
MLNKIARYIKLKWKSYIQSIYTAKKLPASTKIVKKNTIRRTKTILPYNWIFALSAILCQSKLGIIVNVSIRIRGHKGVISITIPLRETIKNYSISVLALICKLLLYLISVIAGLF